MIDINLLRSNPELFKENIKKKFQEQKLAIVDEVLKSDQDYRKLLAEAEQWRKKRNDISLSINAEKKQGKDIRHLLEEAKIIPDKIKATEEKAEALKTKRDTLLQTIPNIIDKAVPLGKDASQNVVRKTVGKPKAFTFPIKNHVELAENLGLVDFEASAKMAGNGFYFLKGDLALLNQALLRFVIDFMCKKGYEYIEPPLMMHREVLAAATDTETFKDSIYTVEGDDLCLIGTSEYALCGMMMGKTLIEKELPKKFYSYSMCFRKEIGSHGINEKGLWRNHQFNKVEQFIFCKPEDSPKYYDELLKNTEQIFAALKLPYRVLEMCSGDLATWKTRSADVEVWRPTTKEYGEVASLTNCTDFQARNLNIKVIRNNGEKTVLHTLNNTALATSRAMVAILENYQKKDGTVKVPTVLQKYMLGKKVIGKKDRPISKK